MSKIRILEVIRQGKIGGGESHVIDVVKGLNKSVFEPEVLSFTDGPMITELQENGTNCYVIPTEKRFDFTSWEKVKILIHSKGYNLIHAHGTRAMSNTFYAASKLKLPLIYTVHGWSFHDDQKFLVKKIRTWSEKFLIRYANKVINVSKSSRDSGIEKLGYFNSRVIDNGIDLTKFVLRDNNQSNEIKKSLNIPLERGVVGAVNRLTFQKNPLGLLRAFKLALSENSNIHLLMVGDGELMSEVVDYTKDHNLENHVTLTGNRKDVPDLLSIIDVFCLPSYWEGLSLGLLEAMAMQKAIIASRVDGTLEVIEHEKSGILIEPGDVDQLAERILELSSNTQLRINLGETAYEKVKRDHSVEHMIETLEEEYLRLTNGSRNKEH